MQTQLDGFVGKSRADILQYLCTLMTEQDAKLLVNAHVFLKTFVFLKDTLQRGNPVQLESTPLVNMCIMAIRDTKVYQLLQKEQPPDCIQFIRECMNMTQFIPSMFYAMHVSNARVLYVESYELTPALLLALKQDVFSASHQHVALLITIFKHKFAAEICPLYADPQFILSEMCKTCTIDEFWFAFKNISKQFTQNESIDIINSSISNINNNMFHFCLRLFKFKTHDGSYDECVYKYIKSTTGYYGSIDVFFTKQMFLCLQYVIKNKFADVNWINVLKTNNIPCIDILCKQNINAPLFVAFLRKTFTQYKAIQINPWNSTYIWMCLFRGGYMPEINEQSVARRTRNAFAHTDIEALVGEACIPYEIDTDDYDELKKTSGYERLNCYLDWVAVQFIPYLHTVHTTIAVSIHPLVGMVAARVLHVVDCIMRVYAACDVSATIPDYVSRLIALTQKLTSTSYASAASTP
jgi:hypothetical protein